MARDSRREESREHAEFGESMRKETAPEPMEDLNKFYNRKQRTKESEVATDCDAEFAAPDRDCDAEENFSYGRTGYQRPRERQRRNEGFEQGSSGSGLDALHRGASSKHSREDG